MASPWKSGDSNVMATETTGGYNNSKLLALVAWIHSFIHLVTPYSLWNKLFLEMSIKIGAFPSYISFSITVSIRYVPCLGEECERNALTVFCKSFLSLKKWLEATWREGKRWQGLQDQHWVGQERQEAVREEVTRGDLGVQSWGFRGWWGVGEHPTSPSHCQCWSTSPFPPSMQDVGFRLSLTWFKENEDTGHS